VVLSVGLPRDWFILAGGAAPYSAGASFGYWLNTALTLGLWIGVWIVFRALGQSRRDELGRLRAESATRALELDALRARLNPHFVFNALNNVRALINEDAERARTLVTHLSSTLRHALVHSQRDRVSLAEEWAVVGDYLAVEAVHFEQRLRLDLFLDPRLQTRQVPPMLLQVLVENAIKHGIACTPGGGLLRLHVAPCATTSAQAWLVIVENPGRLLAASHTVAGSTGIGLAWLRQQIERISPTPRFALIQTDPQRVRAELEFQQ
jgi:LytS/YehU family sensor histidine kinase